MSYVDEHPEYWEDYNNLQHVKHALLRRYLGGWFPILSSWHGRVLYIDCHAGKGQHVRGQKGSPLVALDVLLTHTSLPKVLQNTEVLFVLIERDRANKQELEGHLKGHTLPAKVKVEVICEDYEKVINGLVDPMIRDQSQMAPAFVFVDPYGFKLSMDTLAKLKSFERCELFVNFMWRWVDMAIQQPAQEENMDSLFGCPEWRELRDVADPPARCEAAIQLFQKRLGARFVTWIKMLGENRSVKYILIHATNHPKGRELMKDAVWHVAPEGEFVARVADNPEQEFLIEPEPNLADLEEGLWRKYRGREIKCQEMEDELIETIYLPKHLHDVLRKFRDSGQIQCSGYSGRFAFNKNPLISFNPKPARKRREEVSE